MLLIIFSCSRNNSSDKYLYYMSFDKEISVQGERIGPIDVLLKPIQLSIFRDSMLIINDDGGETFFYFLDINKGNILGNFGRKGNGPKEFIFPDLATKLITSNEVLITNKAKFYSAFFNIDSMLINNNYFPDKKIFYPVNLVIPYNIFEIKDTLIIGQTSSGDCRFFTLNPENEHFRLIKSDLKFSGSNNINQADLGQILYSSTDFNPNRNKIVSSVRAFDQIDIIDAESLELERSICNSKTIDKQYKYSGALYNKETMFYYIDIQATDRYIFGLYFGKSFMDPNPNVSNELHVFDWDGRALFKITLNIGVSKFVIDQDNKRMFGLDNGSDQPVVSYNLLGLL